jgi:phospholipase/carboxylesterase
MTLSGPRRDAQSGEALSLVIFLHGYGADGNDLIGIGDALAEHLPNTMFLAPNAPEQSAMNPMGRQWFPIPRPYQPQAPKC